MTARALIVVLAATAASAALGTPAGRAAAGCPAAKPPAPEVSARPGATGTLVPRGADSLLLCRYAGLNPPGRAGRLARSRLVETQAEVGRLAADLDAVRPTPPGAVFSCPMDDGSEILALFEYRSGPADPVTVDLTGCTFATNGHVTRMAGTAIVSQLEALAG